MQPGMVWRLSEGNGVVGRTSRAHIHLEDDGVSREHARFTTNDDGFVSVVDLGSTNGTWVNGARIDAAIVREGDRIGIGPDVMLRFGYATAAASDGAAGSSTVGSSQPPASPAPPTEPPIALSPRELEVAALAAEGLTNAQIGQQLHISPYTVMTHLSNAYQRIGVKSRAALAKLFAQGRLVVRSRDG